MSLEAVIEKIRRLRALSQSQNEHEAAAAAAAAERLMQEHRIAEAEVEAAGASAEASEPVTQPEEPGAVFGVQIPNWKYMLFGKLAELHGCSFYTDHRRTRAADGVIGYERIACLIGRTSDTAMVAYLYAWLSVETERLTQKIGRGRGRTWMNSYRLGCVAGICEAMERAEETSRQQVTSAALVKLDARMVAAEAFRDAKHPDLRSESRSGSRINRGAFETGKEHGRNLQQRGALPTSAGPRMLGSRS